MKRAFQTTCVALLLLAMLFSTACSARVFHPLTISPSPIVEEKVTTTPNEFFGLGVYEPEDFVFSGRVFLVGDSTVCGTYSDGRVQREDIMGWGKYFGNYFRAESDEEGVDGVSVYNFALSGGSSRTYLDSTGYQSVLEHLSKGDYLFIQFGHNDEHESDMRVGTSATLGRDEVGPTGMSEEGIYSFEWILYEKYIQLARNVGAVPVLVSPTARMLLESGQPNVYRHEPYRKVMKKLAEEEGVLFIDLTELSREFYLNVLDTEGIIGTWRLHAFTDESHQVVDTTHLSRYGAYRIAGLVAKEVQISKVALSKLVVEPTEIVSPRAD